MELITVHTITAKKGNVSLGVAYEFNPDSTFMANFHYNGSCTKRIDGKVQKVRIYTSYANGCEYYAIPAHVAVQYPNIGKYCKPQLWNTLDA